MMNARYHVGKQPAHIGVDVPLTVLQIIVVYGVRADNAVKKSLLVRIVKQTLGIARKKRQADCRNHFFCALLFQEFHCFKQRPPCSEHIVRHERHLAAHIPQQLDRLDIRVFAVLRDNRIIALFVNHGERLLQPRRVKLVAVNRARVGRHHNQIIQLVGCPEQPQHLTQNLIACVQVFQMRLVKRIDNFARMNIQRDNARYAHVLKNMPD